MRKKLLDLCDFYSGTGFPMKYQGKIQDELPFYKVGDIANNVVRGNVYLKMCKNYISETEAKEIKGTIIPPNTVVFAKIGEALRLNRRAITTTRCLIDNNAMGIAPLESEISLKYFYYFMCNLKMESFAESTTVPSVRKSKLEEVEIDLPNMQEQHNIEKILDEIVTLMQLSKIQLEQYDILIKSRFVEMFGNPFINPMRWKKMRLGDVCDVRDGTHDSPRYYDIGYPLLTSKNVTSGIIDLNDCNYISESDYFKINERSKVDIGDIIMPMIGTVGKPVIVNVEPNFAIKNVALIKFNNTSIVDNIYVKVFLESEYFDKSVLSKIRGGTQKFIALGDIRKLEILLPTIDKQQEFRDFVYQVDKLKFMLSKQNTKRKDTLYEY